MSCPHGNPIGKCDICDEVDAAFEAGKQSALAEQPAPVQQEPVALRDALASALTSVYVCGRVWSAWGVGTMSEDDFSPASECDEVLDELVSAVASVAPQPAQRKQLTTQEIREWWASENGLEDCNTSKLDDFEKVVRAVEAKHVTKDAT